MSGEDEILRNDPPVQLREVRVSDPVAERSIETGVEAGAERHRVVVRVDHRPVLRSDWVSTRVTAGWFPTRQEALHKTLVKLVEMLNPEVLDPEVLVKMLRLRVVDMAVAPGQGTYLDRMERDK